MLSMSKDVETNVSLDVLKLIDSTAKDVVAMVDTCFYSNGALHETNAIRQLNGIKGRMMVLRGIVECTKK